MCINYDPVKTVTQILQQGQHRSYMQKTVILTLKGKTFKKWASEQIIHEFEKEIKPRGCSDPLLYMYMTFIVKQVYWYLRSQVSVYRTIGPLVLHIMFVILFLGGGNSVRK